MSVKEYRQVCMDADSIKVILEFPDERPHVQEEENDGIKPRYGEQTKKEIRDILTGVLLEKMKL